MNVTQYDWQQMLIAKGLLSMYEKDNLNSNFDGAISKTQRIFNQYKEKALIK